MYNHNPESTNDIIKGGMNHEIQTNKKYDSDFD